MTAMVPTKVEFGDYKDANEVLVKKDSDALQNTIKNAKNFPLEGVLNISNLWDNVLNYNQNGVKNYNIGLPNSDTFIKIGMGEWSVVSATRELCVQLASDAQGMLPAGVYCPCSVFCFSLLKGCFPPVCIVRVLYFVFRCSKADPYGATKTKMQMESQKIIF